MYKSALQWLFIILLCRYLLFPVQKTSVVLSIRPVFFEQELQWHMSCNGILYLIKKCKIANAWFSNIPWNRRKTFSGHSCCVGIKLLSIPPSSAVFNGAEKNETSE